MINIALYKKASLLNLSLRGRGRSNLYFFLLFILLIILLTIFNRSSNKPMVIILPHHNIVKDIRLSFLRQFSNQSIEHIIILSPDHFSENQYSVSYADKNWDTENGRIKYDQKLGLLITKDLAKQNGILSFDHGITNLLPDIKNIWPKAEIVPVIIGQQVKFSRLKDLLLRIKNNCNKDCTIIASVDFSHYLPRALSEIHDQKSLRILNNLDNFNEKDLEVDSPQSLYIATQIAKTNNLNKWNLYAHTNTGIIEKSRDSETTSHIFGWWNSEKGSKKENSTKTFLIAKNIDYQKDKLTLGERFFYGVDYLNLALNLPYKPNQKIIIEPTDNPSTLKSTGGNLKIFLGKDMAIGGIISGEKITITILPISQKDGQNIPLRGKEKTDILIKIMSTIKDNNIQLDIPEGLVVLLN